VLGRSADVGLLLAVVCGLLLFAAQASTGVSVAVWPAVLVLGHPIGYF